MSLQEENITFVREVEKHEVLYNYNHHEYYKKHISEKAWRDIAVNVNATVHECKKRWHNLRQVYKRSLRPISDKSRRSAYYLMDAMKFCMPYLRAHPTPLENVDSSSPDSFDVDPSPIAKRNSVQSSQIKKSKSAAKVDKCMNEYFKLKKARLETDVARIARKEYLQMFVLSLLPELEDLNDFQIKLFKRRLLSIIDEINK